jgi:hypothetical protein
VDKHQIGNLVKNVTIKPAQDVEAKLMEHINDLNARITALEARIVELENKEVIVSFG